MSSFPEVRRKDRLMSAEDAWAFLAGGYSGRLATVGMDGFPYITPLLHVTSQPRIFVHGANAAGHLRTNVDFCQQACFEVDAPGETFAYGRFECDSALAYASVIAFGSISVVEDSEAKQAFCMGLMEKYGSEMEAGRPKGFFPRLDAITVYMVEVTRITGKLVPLPPQAEQWPARDRTMSPSASPPGDS
jgi:nitroimidazol reductase NimA-like FMN-containing flavoprotein (pyridoxamine 5'-phosphate oxidase superfamily)